jgi:peptide/nickel transport system substrate-binding protein
MTRAVTLALAATVALIAHAGAQPATQQTPKRGGILTYAVVADPATFDCHATASFTVYHYIAPHYSTLLRYVPDAYPKIEGDVAESWTASPDHLTYRFKLRPNVYFHDGSKLTAEDIKASWDRMRNPPQGVVSIRQNEFSDIADIKVEDPLTVTFTLSKPNSGIMDVFAGPLNCIYSAAKLKEDPNYPARNVLGTGPFVFENYTRGAEWTGKRFDKYFREGLPYLDGFKASVMATPALVERIAAGQIDTYFGGLQPPNEAKLKEARNDIDYLTSPWTVANVITFNTRRKPLDDARVRRALSLAINRWDFVDNISKLLFVKYVGGVLRPGYDLATPEAELPKLFGMGKDITAARAEAKRLLAEAGVKDLKLKMLTFGNQQLYTTVSVYLIEQWRQIGVTVEPDAQEAPGFFGGLRAGNFDIGNDFNLTTTDDPNAVLAKFVAGASNFSGSKDEVLENLYEKQKRALDVSERRKLIAEFEQRLLDQAYAVPISWSQRVIPIPKYMHGWYIAPSTLLNQDLGTVWLSK